MNYHKEETKLLLYVFMYNIKTAAISQLGRYQSVKALISPGVDFSNCFQ